MSIITSGVARIRHAETGEVYTIQADELDWNEVAADERQMGVEVAHSATVDHPQLGLLTWTLWEYPLGMENDREVDIGPHAAIETFRISLGGDGAEAAEDRAARIEELVEWFFERFEDPAQRTPHDSGEGGYIWIWGGPYDAREQIGENFPDEDESLIEAAVERVERDGIVDWAPVASARDYDDGEDDEPDDEGMSAADDDETPDGAVTRPNLVAILESIPEEGGPVFARDDHDRIELARWTPSPAPDADLLEALRGQTADLLAQLEGTNAHQDLLASVRRYGDAIVEAPPSISRLYVEGVQMEHVAAQVESAIRVDDRPPLPGTATAVLGSVREMHGVFIAMTPEGIERLEASARYRRSAEAQETLTRSATELSQAIQTATDLFGPKARDLAAEASGLVGQGPRQERSNQASVGLLKTIVVSAVVSVGMIGFESIVGGGLAATSLGGTLQQGVTTLANAAGGFILSHVDALRTFAAAVGPELTWLRQLTDWISARRAPESRP